MGNKTSKINVDNKTIQKSEEIKPQSDDKNKRTRRLTHTLIVYGFIRSCQEILPIDNSYYIIPSPLYQICFNYYYIIDAFHREYSKDTELLFLSDTIVSARTDRDGWSTCIFGNEITPEICSEYSITIKWKKANRYFYMGWIQCLLDEYMERYSANVALGHSKRKSCDSVGIYVYKNCQDLWIYMNGKVSIRTDEIEGVYYKQGSEFRMIFNFEKDNVIICHNEREIHKMSLEGIKVFIPAFSFFTIGEEIEVTNVCYS